MIVQWLQRSCGYMILLENSLMTIYLLNKALKYDIVILKYFNRLLLNWQIEVRSQGKDCSDNVNYYDSTSKYITNEEYLDI